MSHEPTSPIVVITALPEERDAVLETLDNVEKVPLDGKDSRVYFRGYARRDEIIVMCLPNMGRVAANGATLDALNRWQPQLVFMVGIAGGVRKNAVEVGDVLIAQQIIDYEVQKITEIKTSHRFQTYRTDAKLFSISQNILRHEWIDLFPKDRPTDGEPKVHLGPMASGDKVIAKQALLDEILEHFPKLIGVEMEAAGVANAVAHSQHAPRFLMIRGVSDLADGAKDSPQVGEWRRYACEVPVSFMHALLRQNLRNIHFPSNRAEPSRPDENQLFIEEIARLEETMCRERASGRRTDAIQKQILELRRELRAGPQLSPGDFLSNCKYELLERIGYGGFATVWKAIDRKAKDLVAIKVLHHQWASDEERAGRFRRGATRMKRLGHPHIVQVYEEECLEDGFRYYVMEFAGDMSLHRYVLHSAEFKVFSIERKLSIIFQVADALVFAHSRNTIHRDVKPQNILIDDQGVARLTDFDLVWVADTTGGTRTGALGTFVFAAPECLKDASKAVPASDVFSLAMTTLFVLRGEELEFEAFRDPAKLIHGLEGVPRRAKEVLIRACEWDVMRRTQSVTTFVRELKNALVSGDDDADTVSWLDRGKFAQTCVTKYRADYAEVRGSQRWPVVLDATSDLAGFLFEGCRSAFETTTDPFGHSGPVHTFVSTYPVMSLPGLSEGSVEMSEVRILRWLALRRLVLMVVEIYGEHIAGDRSRLEVLLATFLNFVRPASRTPEIVVHEVKSELFTLRPQLTQWGFSPRDLLQGTNSIPTLGGNERNWIEQVRSEQRGTVPNWWNELFAVHTTRPSE